MSILNQTNTRQRCPKEMASLISALENRDGGPDSSMMDYVNVYCLTLAIVLDRLEALEEFADDMKQLAKEKINSI